MPIRQQLGIRSMVLLVAAALALLGLVALATAPQAAAGPGSPNLPEATDAVYPAPVAGQGFSGAPDVVNQTESGDPVDPAALGTANGGLPFTGLSAATMLLVGVLALLVGFALRRLSARPD